MDQSQSQRQCHIPGVNTKQTKATMTTPFQIEMLPKLTPIQTKRFKSAIPTFSRIAVLAHGVQESRDVVAHAARECDSLSPSSRTSEMRQTVEPAVPDQVPRTYHSDSFYCSTNESGHESEPEEESSQDSHHAEYKKAAEKLAEIWGSRSFECNDNGRSQLSNTEDENYYSDADSESCSDSESGSESQTEGDSDDDRDYSDCVTRSGDLESLQNDDTCLENAVSMDNLDVLSSMGDDSDVLLNPISPSSLKALQPVIVEHEHEDSDATRQISNAAITRQHFFPDISFDEEPQDLGTFSNTDLEYNQENESDSTATRGDVASPSADTDDSKWIDTLTQIASLAVSNTNSTPDGIDRVRSVMSTEGILLSLPPVQSGASQTSECTDTPQVFQHQTSDNSIPKIESRDSLNVSASISGSETFLAGNDISPFSTNNSIDDAIMDQRSTEDEQHSQPGANSTNGPLIVSAQEREDHEQVMDSDDLNCEERVENSLKSESQTSVVTPTPPFDEREQDSNFAYDIANTYDRFSFDMDDTMPTWRTKDAELLSDFVVDIEGLSSGAVRTFFLHQHAVAVGPTRSEYFHTLLLSDRGTQIDSVTPMRTMLVMEDEAAGLFPTVLDYLYLDGWEIELYSDTAVPLRYLTRMLEMEDLQEKAAAFIHSDMQLTNLDTYIADAIVFGDEKVAHMASEKCAYEIANIEPGDALWTAMTPNIFMHMISSPVIDRESLSAHLSTLLVEYYSLHRYEIDEELFLQMTAREILPHLDRKTALQMLEIIQEHDDIGKFTSLQNRCTLEISKHWRTTSNADRRRVFSFLRALPSSYTVDFLELVETGKFAGLKNALGQSRHLSSKANSKYRNRLLNLAEDNDVVCSSLRQQLSIHDEPRTMNPQEKLCWRMNPAESFSDCTLEVRSIKYGDPTIYHVHKHKLVTGTRKSRLLKEQLTRHPQQLRSNDGIRGVSETSNIKIQLDYTAAVLIPDLLDYMYGNKDGLKLITETCVSTRFVARYFGITPLNQQTIDFIRDDISLCNVAHYAEESKLYQDETVANIAAALCAARIEEVGPDSPMLKDLAPQFFLRIVSSPVLNRQTSSEHVSTLIAEYYTIHANDLQEVFLQKLVHPANLPQIQVGVVLKLLKILEKVEDKQHEVIQALQKKCVKLLEENWALFREKHRDETFKALGHLDATLVASLFDAIELDYFDKDFKTMSLQSKLVKRYRSQIADGEDRRERETTKLRETMQKQIDELQKKWETAETQLKTHQESMSRRSARGAASYGYSPRNSERISPTTPTIFEAPSSSTLYNIASSWSFK